MKRLLPVCLAVFGLCAVALAQNVLSPAQFTEEYARALRKAAPKLRVEVVEPLQIKVDSEASGEHTTYLDNAYGLYKRDPQAKDEIIRNYVVSSLETFTADTAPVDRSRVVPVIKDRAWLEEIRQVAQSKGAKKPLDQIYDALNGELVILYAEDSEKSIRYLTADDVKTLGVAKKDLRKLATQNLRKMLPKIERHEGNGVYMLTAGGNYEASLLLLDEIWAGKSLKVKGDIVVAVPSREVLLVTGSEDARGIEKIRQVSERIFAEEPYRLTTTLFVYKGGKFTEFKPGAKR